MMNLMIVEDEPPILREIKSTILSFPENYTIEKYCYNGQDAMEFLNEHHKNIDVLITDIHLPVIDGLDLLEYVSEKFPRIICIILSGYNDFEYAKRAIKLSVYDYLLKPVDEDELHEVLKKAYEKKCIDNISPIKPVHLSNQTTSASDSVFYYLSYICLGSYPYNSYIHSESMDKYWNYIEMEYFKKTFSEFCNNYWLIGGYSSSERILLLSLSRKDFSLLYNTLKKLAAEISVEDTPITIVTLDQTISIHNISSYIHMLQKYIQQHICFAQSQLLCYESEPALPDDFNQLYPKIDKLAQLFENKNISLFENELYSFLCLMKKNSLTQTFLQRLLNSLFSQCFSFCIPKIDRKTTDSFTTVNDILYLSTSYDNLYVNLKSIFDDMFQIIIDSNDTADRQSILLRIDHYIRNHYKDNINTKTIADHFNFTPAYLSKIFREYKNVSPADYITSLRLEKAKELLSKPSSLSIKDVAAYIGYEDSLYFSKVFKKYTGQSPKNYQLHPASTH